MRYFVILSDGQRFGPADAALLSQWAIEKRLDATTMVEEEGTGRQMQASMVPGISFPQAQMFQATPDYNQPPGGQAPGGPQTPGGPQQSYSPPGGPQPGGYQMPGPTPYVGYQRQMAMGDNGQSEYTTALILTLCGFFLCCVFLTIPGLIYANKADQKGHPSAKTVRTFAIVVLVIQVILIIVRIIMAAVLIGGSAR